MYSKQSRGFTLIELLVVIAIIAILASILLPVFLSVKASARKVICASNLVNLGKAMRMYADDNNGYLPARASGYEGVPSGSFDNWCGATNTGSSCVCLPQRGTLYPYVKNVKIFLCRNDEGKPAPNISPSQRYTFPLSYAMNFKFAYRNLDTMRRRGMSQSDYPYSPGVGANKQMARIMMLIQEDRRYIDDGDFNLYNAWDTIDNSHNKGTNVLYCDLHVRWDKYEELNRARWDGEWDPDRYF